jgi:hypothetical protein
MGKFTGFQRFIPALAATLLLAGSLAMAPQAQAWDWNWGFGKSVKGSGVLKSESRNVSGFSKISLSVPGNAELVQGNSEGLTIETDDNILPLIETVVEGDALKIRFIDKNTSVSTKTLKLVINAKTIEGLSVAGSGDVRAAKIQTGELKASIAGSGDVQIGQLDADALTISIAGSGNFAAGGKVKRIESKIAGSGDMKIGKLEADSVKISIAGSGDATVWAKDSLSISVAGSGDVKYFGDAKIVKQSVAGSGSVKRLGAAPGA